MKKLTSFEKEDRKIKQIIQRIINIEKQHGIKFTRKACIRYYSKRGNELALKRKITDAKKELLEMNKEKKKRLL